jgi:hypothetical protein
VNPNVTFVEVHGKRIYSVLTGAGAVHLVSCCVHEHLSDAIRAIKPKAAELDEEAVVMVDGTGVKIEE